MISHASAAIKQTNEEREAAASAAIARCAGETARRKAAEAKQQAVAAEVGKLQRLLEQIMQKNLVGSVDNVDDRALHIDDAPVAETLVADALREAEAAEAALEAAVHNVEERKAELARTAELERIEALRVEAAEQQMQDAFATKTAVEEGSVVLNKLEQLEMAAAGAGGLRPSEVRWTDS
eukprot:SAG31_NODE_4938_length_2849_cov_2.097091_5_plen_180_part_00